MKNIVLCADDYGQSAAISAGILQLVQQQRLSAVSCLSESEHWPQAGALLGEWRDRIDVGMHFNLTHPFPGQSLRAQPLTAIMRSALVGGIDRRAVAAALHAQLDRFETVLQQAPDFVDGHQHVHILPGIRQLLLTELAHRYSDRRPYLRAVIPRLRLDGNLVKTAVLRVLGTGFRTAAARSGFATNSGFGGIYSLRPQENFAALMDAWLASAHSGDLLMCHPGSADHDESDPIGSTRPLELAFLRSAAFADLLQRSAVRLSRFRDLGNSPH